MGSVKDKGIRFVKRMRKRLIHAWDVVIAKKHYYVSMESYANEYPENIEVLSRRVDGLVYANKCNKSVELKQDNRYVNRIVVLRNVIVFIYSDIILLHDGRCIYELKELNRMRAYANYQDEILLTDTDRWCKLRSCAKEQHIEKGIKIGGMFGFNYYHFMFQLLPKMLEIKNIDSSVPILLDAAARNIPSMRQLVEWCNRENREIIYMEYDIAYHVNELYSISSPNICVPNWKKGVRYTIPAAEYSITDINALSQILMPHKSNTYPKKEKIFISRKNTDRRKYNEDELWGIAKKYGFEMICPEELTMAEQIALFNNAKIIIAATGAALTNLIFCSPSCSLVMMSNSHLSRAIFSSLILMRGGDVHELYYENVNNEYQNNFYILPDALKAVLSNIFYNNEK